MVTSGSWRVLLVDDHNLFRKGIASLMAPRNDLEVVGEADNGGKAIEMARALGPDLILMDIHMPGGEGLGAVKAIKKEMPAIKIVMLTVSAADDDLFTAIKNGADGYLLKDLDPAQLFVLLEGIRRGEAPISGVLAERILQEFRKPDDGLDKKPDLVEALTPMEIETLELLVGGDTNKEIAAKLHVSASTVKLYLHNIMQKLHVRNRLQLAAYALRKQLVEDPSDSQPMP
jgi:two-component system, NarL family, nitrate/nitrite response regulator NarL